MMLLVRPLGHCLGGYAAFLTFKALRESTLQNRTGGKGVRWADEEAERVLKTQQAQEQERVRTLRLWTRLGLARFLCSILSHTMNKTNSARLEVLHLLTQAALLDRFCKCGLQKSDFVDVWLATISRLLETLRPTAIRVARDTLFWFIGHNLEFLQIEQLVELKLTLEASLFLVEDEQRRRLALTHTSSATQTDFDSMLHGRKGGNGSTSKNALELDDCRISEEDVSFEEEEFDEELSSEYEDEEEEEEEQVYHPRLAEEKRLNCDNSRESECLSLSSSSSSASESPPPLPVRPSHGDEATLKLVDSIFRGSYNIKPSRGTSGENFAQVQLDERATVLSVSNQSIGRARHPDVEDFPQEEGAAQDFPTRSEML